MQRVAKRRGETHFADVPLGKTEKEEVAEAERRGEVARQIRVCRRTLIKEGRQERYRAYQYYTRGISLAQDDIPMSTEHRAPSTVASSGSDLRNKQYPYPRSDAWSAIGPTIPAE